MGSLARVTVSRAAVAFRLQPGAAPAAAGTAVGSRGVCRVGRTRRLNLEVLKKNYNILVPKQRQALIKAMEKEMLELAKNLEFERAAVVRDEVKKIQEMEQ